ncbi:MAG: ATP-binding cassette domain-containing protein [Micrococcales bacterium]|nr:ATP-binding cassette domain-containing protein [Micrococcales bacterium]
MIKLSEVTFDYLRPDGTAVTETPQLNRVNLEIAAGQFVLVCGPTGSGKSTLLKVLNGLAPSFTGGLISGRIEIDGIDLTGKPPHEYAGLVGYVNQQPEGSFVAVTVIDELVYGAEQLGVSKEQIQIKLDEITEILEIKDLLDRNLESLSGGQQQRVAIGAALALKTLAHNSGVTILLAEHRISRVIAEVDSMLVVHGDGSVTHGLVSDQFNDARFAPPIIELGLKLAWQPLEISAAAAAQRWQSSPAKYQAVNLSPQGEPILKTERLKVIYADKVALAETTLSFYGNQITAVMGENGSGKTSLCWALQGLGQRSGGSALIEEGDTAELAKDSRLDLVAMVPQRAADLLFLNTLADEFNESDRFAQAPQGSTAQLFQKIAGRIDTSVHPRDLSAGQQLALVLSIQLVKQAKVLILDEPTRGLDYSAKKALAARLLSLKASSRTIVLASHDVEFVAMVSDRVIQLKNGQVVSDETVVDALSWGKELATQLAMISKTPGLINIEQVQA